MALNHCLSTVRATESQHLSTSKTRCCGTLHRFYFIDTQFELIVLGYFYIQYIKIHLMIAYRVDIGDISNVHTTNNEDYDDDNDGLVQSMLTQTTTMMMMMVVVMTTTVSDPFGKFPVE